MMLFVTKKKLEEMIDEKLEKLERRSNEKIKANRSIIETWTSVMVKIMITNFAIDVIKENNYEVNSDVESKINWYVAELNNNIRLAVVIGYTLEFSEIVKIQTADNTCIEIRYFEDRCCADNFSHSGNNRYYNKIIKIDIPNNTQRTKED